MRQLLLNPVQETPFSNSLHRPVKILKLCPQKLCPQFSKRAPFREKCFFWPRLSLKGRCLLKHQSNDTLPSFSAALCLRLV